MAGRQASALQTKKTHTPVIGSGVGRMVGFPRLDCITAGSYNMPGWEGGFNGFYRCLESLFTRTPPTAIFIYSAAEYVAVAQFLLNRGLRVPQDVSLICCNMAPYFNRYQPTISYVRWNNDLMVNRIGRWANNISRGKEDTRQTLIDAEFIEGGTVGPAPAPKS